eukprot:SM000081S22668  [mRNA]  locus=s81:384504:389821:- [translate_table: standard]
MADVAALNGHGARPLGAEVRDSGGGAMPPSIGTGPPEAGSHRSAEAKRPREDVDLNDHEDVDDGHDSASRGRSISRDSAEDGNGGDDGPGPAVGPPPPPMEADGGDGGAEIQPPHDGGEYASKSGVSHDAAGNGDGGDGKNGLSLAVGPPVPPQAKRRKKPLTFEKVYLDALPCAEMYEKSYMHRDVVTHVAISDADFFITASQDGHLKFWKKKAIGIEFVKHFRAHVSAITDLKVSVDGTLCCTVSKDKAAKVFDILSFDMMAMLKLPYVPHTAEWAFKHGDAKAKLAIAEEASPRIHIYDAKSGSNDPIQSVEIHRNPVLVMKYMAAADVVISADAKGIIEYWSPETLQFPSSKVSFKYKTDTDLYALAKANTVATSLETSTDGRQFAVVSPDRRIRVFWFATGKLRRTYDESQDAAQELQRSEAELYRLEAFDFGRRLAVERELEKAEGVPSQNAVFDESGNFLLYPTLLGIKVVSLHDNKVARIIGKVENTERFLRIALYQGSLGKKIRKIALSSNVGDKKDPLTDPTLLCCAFRKHRLYLFSQREPEEGEDATQGRDVFNEKPPPEELLALADVARASASSLPDEVVLHTTLGDVNLKLYPEECPRTVENFSTHCRNGYYDNLIFHRVIKGFMVQTGDPLGDGTGGQSVWGGEFEDEFHKSLRHDRPFTLSMANAGPNTNGSQFFITTVATPWLDNKHTVFGRVVKGADVVQAIEKTKVDKNDKPYTDVKILNISGKTLAAARSIIEEPYFSCPQPENHIVALYTSCLATSLPASKLACVGAFFWLAHCSELAAFAVSACKSCKLALALKGALNLQ